MLECCRGGCGCAGQCGVIVIVFWPVSAGAGQGRLISAGFNRSRRGIGPGGSGSGSRLALGTLFERQGGRERRASTLNCRTREQIRGGLVRLGEVERRMCGEPDDP